MDIEASPPRKRGRYEPLEPLNSSETWTLSRNEVILHGVYDSGVERLELESDYDFDLEFENHEKEAISIDSLYSSDTPNSKYEQIAVLEASLPENTLQKLSLGEIGCNIFTSQDSELESQYNATINHFDRLSDEVVLQIFQYLSKSQLCNMALTCKRFSQLAEDESLWTRMDVSNRTLEDGAIGTILSRQVVILKMSRTRVVGCPILHNSKAMDRDFRSRLMYLDLTMANISTNCLATLLSKCRRLKKLSLESLNVNSMVFKALGANRDLEVLNLAMVTGINHEGIKCLLKGCRNIKELNLAWTYLSSDCISYICDNLPITLDRFNFSGCRKLLQDENVAQIVINCPHLRELDLSDCTAITGKSIKSLTTLEELNFLALSRCYLVTSRSLIYLKKMKSLAYLDLHGSFPSNEDFNLVKEGLGLSVNINKFKFSSIARPVVGLRKGSIWNMKVRD